VSPRQTQHNENLCTLSSEMLTITELRGFPGLEKLTDKEATEIIISLHQLSRITMQVIEEAQNCTKKY